MHRTKNTGFYCRFNLLHVTFKLKAVTCMIYAMAVLFAGNASAAHALRGLHAFCVHAILLRAVHSCLRAAL